MVFLLFIGCPIVVLLVIAVVMDRKSKRVRGHVGRVRNDQHAPGPPESYW